MLGSPIVAGSAKMTPWHALLEQAARCNAKMLLFSRLEAPRYASTNDPQDAKSCRDVLSKHFAQAEKPDRKSTVEQSCLMSQSSVEEDNCDSACDEAVTRSQREDTAGHLVSAR